MPQNSWRDKQGVVHLVSFALSRYRITYCDTPNQPGANVTLTDRGPPTCFKCIAEQQALR